MTRINTNVSSLTAQQNLAKSNSDLQTALTRLSTGLRINSGKDDPAGMIAAAQLGSDIASTNQAISNTKAAEAMIDTADMSLSQVTTLLNEVRALIVQTANDSTMSADQIAANQSQIDSAMAAIDRIAQTTNYQGRKLLDGSMDFIYSDTGVAGTDISLSNNVSNVLITQANLSLGPVTATTHVTTEATQGEISTDGITSAAAPASASVDTGDTTPLVISAANNGTALNGTTIHWENTTSIAEGEALATYDAGQKLLTIYYNDGSSTDVIATTLDTAITAIKDAEGNSIFATDSGGDLVSGTTVADTTMTDGTDGGITGDVSFELLGNEGSKTFTFDSGTTGLQMKEAINLLTSSTGVVADWDGTDTLTLNSSEYGSSQYVQIKMISDGTTVNPVTGEHVFTEGFGGIMRGEGDDIIGKINGYTATGNGNTLSINTPALAMSITMNDPDSGDPLTGRDLVLSITGGGALFQLGPDINSNNQANMGIQSVSTGSLGGVNGRLFQLLTGGDYSLTGGDLNTSTKIVDEALNQLTSLRGRLGAFEKATLETNTDTLSNVVTALTSAQSNIQDADFAAETANLTRAQILVQSGTAVLKIANQNPQNVLALLQ
jgi:flagellin